MLQHPEVAALTATTHSIINWLSESKGVQVTVVVDNRQNVNTYHRDAR